jgi:hypothetical protein
VKAFITKRKPLMLDEPLPMPEFTPNPGRKFFTKPPLAKEAYDIFLEHFDKPL